MEFRIKFSGKTLSIIDWIKYTSNAKDRAQVLMYSVRFLEWFIIKQREGWKIGAWREKEGEIIEQVTVDLK